MNRKTALALALLSAFAVSTAVTYAEEEKKDGGNPGLIAQSEETPGAPKPEQSEETPGAPKPELIAQSEETPGAPKPEQSEETPGAPKPELRA